MSKKQKPLSNGYVYSTDPGFRADEEKVDAVTPAVSEQPLRIRLDTKQRGGKAVTLVEGFQGKETDLEALGKTLKKFCGTGGSTKDRLIIIQGDQRDKLLNWLLKEGYLKSKRI